MFETTDELLKQIRLGEDSSLELKAACKRIERETSQTTLNL